MIKVFGSVCMLIACILLGFLKAQELEIRVTSLKTIHWCCLMMNGEIRSVQPTLPQLFLKISRQISPKYGIVFIEISKELEQKGGQNFLEIWNRNWQLYQKEFCLKAEDSYLLQSLGTSLGYFDRKMQLDTLSYFLERLRIRIEEAEEEKKSGQKVYQMLGITSGFFFIVLFI